MHYRKEVVRRFLADVKRQTPTTIIDVLQAMWMIAKAWNLVTEKTIANYFKTWQRVQEELHLQETDFEDFVTFDNDFAICGELTDADIVTSVLPVTNAEADENEEEEGEMIEHNFAIKDAYNALNTIKSVFLKKGGLSDDVVKSITKLDCALDVITHTGGKQTTINDFFSNQ
ncbi:jg24418 [Pararge aegeria aegeria]|uniref:Jg24418 protein n=1 Tax=Pararge aegeria aegeria TaxID=348720 RepID=A0A8S4QW83_9NEOP|nr:jg24418 [Pararge aegeria aegeria]